MFYDHANKKRIASKQKWNRISRQQGIRQKKEGSPSPCCSCP